MEANASGLSLQKITNIEEVENIRQYWNNLQLHPNIDIDIYLTIIKSRNKIFQPYSIIVLRSGIPITIIVGRIDNINFECNIGYKNFYKKKVKRLTFLYGGILGESSIEIFRIVIADLLMILRKKEVDLVYFNNLKINSEIFQAATTIPNFLNGDNHSVKTLHYAANIPEDIETFYKNKKSKHRYWLKRICRILEEEFNGNVKYQIFTNIEDVDKICKDIEQIAKYTYHRGMGVGFIDNDETRNRMKLAAEKGWLRAYILYINETPSAYWLGTLYKNIFYLDYTGYLPDLKKFEAGTCVFLKMIEDLCNNKVNSIDFGFGDALYKQRFSEEKWEEAPVYIFPFSISGISMKFFKLIEIILTQLLKKIFYDIKFINKIKKIWRNRLSS